MQASTGRPLPGARGESEGRRGGRECQRLGGNKDFLPTNKFGGSARIELILSVQQSEAPIANY
jgi:hypothetical protein